MKLIKVLPTLRKAILDEYNSGRVYRKPDDCGGTYICPHCGETAFPMRVSAIPKIDLPAYIKEKEEKLWVKPPYCFNCLS